MGTGPVAAVDPSPRQPPDYSLLGSARLPVEGDERWANGFEWRPEACRTGGVVDPCNHDSGQKAFGPSDNPDLRTYEPFGVWSGAACTTRSGQRVRQLQQEARRGLLGCESFHIGREFWNGTQAQASSWNNPFLRNVAASGILTPAAGVNPIPGLACLEQGLAECACGERGMIHATRQVVTLWRAENLIWPDTLADGRPVLRTALWTIVVPDAGYTGDAPILVTDLPVVSWAYATSMVDVRLSGIQMIPETIPEATDKEKNTVVFRPERVASATWDECCTFAAGIIVVPCGPLQFAS